MTRPRTRIINGRDITRNFLDRHPEGVQLWLPGDTGGQVATVRGVREGRFNEDRVELILDIDGNSKPHRCLGKSQLDWIQD